MALTKTINLNINGSQGLKTLEDLKTKSSELDAQLQTLDVTTPDFKNVKAELEAVNATLATYTQSAQEASDIATEAFVKTSQAIVATTGTLITFAASNDRADQITAKLAKTLAVVESIEKVAQATKATSIFLQNADNVAKVKGILSTNLLTAATAGLTAATGALRSAFLLLAAANPFTLIIASIGLVTGALYAFSKSTADVAEQQSKLNEEFDTTNNLLQEQKKLLLDAIIAEAKRRDLRKGTTDGLKAELLLLKQFGKEEEVRNEKLREQLKILKDSEGIFGLSEEGRKAIKEKEDAIIESNTKILQSVSDANAKQIEINENANKNLNDDNQKRIQLRRAQLANFDDYATKLELAALDLQSSISDIQERELNGDKNTYLDRLIVQQTYLNAKDKLDKEEIARQKAKSKAIIDAGKEVSKETKKNADEVLKQEEADELARQKAIDENFDKRVEIAEKNRNEAFEKLKNTAKDTFDELEKQEQERLTNLIKQLNAVSDAVDNFNSILDQAGVNKGSGLRAINTSLSTILDGFIKIKEDGKITFEEITTESLKSLAIISQAVNESIQASIEQNIESIDEAINAIEEKRKQVDDNINDSLSKQKDLEAQLSDARVGDREKILKAIDAERAREKQLAKDKAKFAEDEKKLNDKKKEEQKKAFIANKIASGIQAAINTAVAVTAALTIPPPAGEILAVLNAIAGAAQVAAIAAAPIPEFRKGGPTKNSRSDNEVAGIVHANEYVISAPIVRSPRFKNTINELERARVTGSYQSGGFTSPTSNDADNKLERVLQTSIDLSNRPIVVTVVDINDGQQRYADVIDQATL